MSGLSSVIDLGESRSVRAASAVPISHATIPGSGVFFDGSVAETRRSKPYGLLRTLPSRYGDVARFWLSCLSAARAICTQPVSQRCAMYVGVSVVCGIPAELSKPS